jgi:hypothetical protein
MSEQQPRQLTEAEQRLILLRATRDELREQIEALALQIAQAAQAVEAERRAQ